ncbi:ATP-dependent microtubule motor [Aureococcus anophagefferens]|nr:ATP-dependent microtubule motor [Aureococcus anophagefferens]
MLKRGARCKLEARDLFVPTETNFASQTGSGKTHTVFGPTGCLTERGGLETGRADWGLFPRVVLALLADGSGALHASAVEVYQERAFDLLNDRAPLTVGGKSAGLKDFATVGETVVRLASAADVARLARTVEATRQHVGHALNDRSSRSHCLVHLRVAVKRGSKVHRRQLLFVDLAGSGAF